MHHSLLIATNGTKESLPTVDYGVWLAGLLQLPVTLLGVVEHDRYAAEIDTALASACQRLEALGLACEQVTRQGDAIPEIRRAAQAKEHLVVAGPLGQPKWLTLLRGGPFRFLAQDISTPLIYVPSLHTRLEHILVCMGGLGYTASVVHWAVYLAKQAHADLTFLHVVGRTGYAYPTTLEVKTHPRDLVDTNTPQGRNLRQALDDARQAGSQARVTVRHGDIIHEIQAELHKGAYDMIAMGSAGSSHSLRHRYMPNVTAEVAERSAVPVLTARLGQELIF